MSGIEVRLVEWNSQLNYGAGRYRKAVALEDHVVIVEQLCAALLSIPIHVDDTASEALRTRAIDAAREALK